MKRKLLAAFFCLYSLIILPVSALADSRSYTPPARKGYVYIVIRYKSLTGQDTNVSVRWGGYSRSGRFTPARALLPGRGIPSGFVLRLEHKKNDSIPIDVETDGRILSIAQSDQPPSEWSNKADYKQETW